MPEDLIDFLKQLFQDATASVGPGINLLIGLLLAFGSYLLVRYLILGFILRLYDPAKYKRFNLLVEARIPHLLTLLVPPVVFRASLPFLSLDTSDNTIALINRLFSIYVVIVFTLLFNATLQAIHDYYDELEYSKTFPITSTLEVVRVILFSLSLAVIISILFNVQAIYILAAIGALIAAGTVVFNNIILAFIAGLVLTSKKLIKIGDWIEIPELRINGEVQEITLTTVIVRNRDHTIGTVPSAYLLSNSFKNWRGVLDDGAREIFWPVYFDINSVKPVNQELLEEISHLPDGAKVIQLKSAANTPGDSRLVLHGDQFERTNLGLFREYFSHYLRNNPLIVPQNLFSVYFDAPTNFGLPMQILVSTRETDYVRFLGIQSGLLEDILRLAGIFDLKVYQSKDRLDPATSSSSGSLG